MSRDESFGQIRDTDVGRGVTSISRFLGTLKIQSLDNVIKQLRTINYISKHWTGNGLKNVDRYKLRRRDICGSRVKDETKIIFSQFFAMLMTKDFGKTNLGK